jgi:hypothetical protein
MGIDCLSSEPTNRPAEPLHPPGANVFHDIWLAFVQPSRVFFNLPRVNRSTTALVILLLALAGLGHLTTRTGVYDYEVKRHANRMAFAYQKSHEGDDDPNAATEMADSIEKGSEFQVIVNRLIAVVGKPLWTLCVVGLVGGFLFVAVALSGGKPKMSLLTGIVVFASFVQVPHAALKLYLTGLTKHTRVETSSAAFPTQLGGEHGVSLVGYIALRRLNPFDLWFWALMFLGLRRAARMTVRGAVISVATMVVFDWLWQSGWDYAELAKQPPPGQEA